MSTEMKHVTILTDGTAGPYITTPVVYVEQIREHLEKLGVRFNIDRINIKMKDLPKFTTFNLSPDCSPEQVAEISEFLNDFSWNVEE
jgi:hypothetical protein